MYMQLLQKLFSYYALLVPAVEEKSIIETQKLFWKKLAIVVPSLGFKLRRTSGLSKSFEVGG